MTIPKGFFNDHLELVYHLCIEPNKENPSAMDADTRAILKKGCRPKLAGSACASNAG